MIVAVHIIDSGSSDEGYVELMDLSKLPNLNKYKHSTQNILDIPSNDWSDDGDDKPPQQYISDIPGLFVSPPQLVEAIYTIYLI